VTRSIKTQHTHKEIPHFVRDVLSIGICAKSTDAQLFEKVLLANGVKRLRKFLNLCVLAVFCMYPVLMQSSLASQMSNTLQLTTTRTTAHYSTLQRSAPNSNTLQRSAPNCNTLHYTTLNILQHTGGWEFSKCKYRSCAQT
jgi:hypothetical protein